VIDPGMTPLERGQLLTDEQYLEAWKKRRRVRRPYGRRGRHDLLRTMDLEKEIARCARRSRTNSETKIKKLSKRLKLMESLRTPATSRSG
jgi:DNA-directed RNA polymerase subunit beta'